MKKTAFFVIATALSLSVSAMENSDDLNTAKNNKYSGGYSGIKKTYRYNKTKGKKKQQVLKIHSNVTPLKSFLEVASSNSEQLTNQEMLTDKVPSKLEHNNSVLVDNFVRKQKKIMTLSDVKFNIQQRNSTSYIFNEEIHVFPFDEKLECFENKFLEEIKSKTHLASGLPNIAVGAITFHYQSGGNNLTKVVKLEELFLSGGKYFDENDLWFKQKHKIVNTFHDMLSPEDYKHISKLRNEDRRKPFELAMEKRLQKEVIGGTWTYNALDSEAILLLRLVEKLPNILKDHLLSGSDKPITLKHAVLSIESYRECCTNCQRLIQGFQWRLRDIILNYRMHNIFVDNNFETFAIVKGLQNNNYQYENEYVRGEFGDVSLKDGHHSLVLNNN